MLSPMTESDKDKLHFGVFYGNAGDDYRAWRQELLDYASGKVDEGGDSLADHALDQDAGGAAGAVIPAGAGHAVAATR